MGWFTGAMRFFTGGTGGKIIDAADKLHYSAEERQTTDQKDLASARQMQSQAGNTGFDVLVNCIARLVRPFITFWLMGGLIGWWDFRPIDRISQFHQSLIYLCFTFWFGGRAITKDIPAFLKALKS